VLEAFARRISSGQLDDLEGKLPSELYPPLERGRAAGGGRPKPISREAFIDAVKRLGDKSTAEATKATRAVLTTLREAVGEKEWHDTTDQLPADYRELWRVRTPPDVG
jgi:uncharacterized protein (DUF2267 family)